MRKNSYQSGTPSFNLILVAQEQLPILLYMLICFSVLVLDFWSLLYRTSNLLPKGYIKLG